jgi:uncharacterized membrane protein
MKPMRGLLTTGNLTTARIEAFSDGVFAIVVTLLVLEIRVPQVHGADLSTQLAAALVALVPKYLSYAMSFVIISIWWVSHHQFFALIKKTDRGLLWLNSLFLLLLAFIPFPTGLLGEYPRERLAVMFFGGALAATGLSFVLMRWYAARRGRLLDEQIGDDLIRHSLRRSLLSPVLYGGAMLLALVNVTASLVALALIPLFYFIPGKLERHAPEEGAAE